MTPREPASGVTGRPTGTVTFVFTDIEGSTRLWQDHPQAMKTAVADHDRIIRTIADEHGGYIFSTGGDGFSIAFTHPLEAALAAVDTQTALTDHDWGEVGDLRVRIALDTGLADERDGDYFGPALSRVARILDQTTGGEILTSNTTADLLTHQLPLGHQLERVGRHHLKDVDGVTTLHRLKSTSETGPRSPLRRPLAATILAVLAITIGWVIFGLLPTGEPPTDGGSGTDTTGTTVQADTDLLWTVELGPLTTSPIIVGDYVIASPDTDTHPVVALYLDTGYEAWTTDMDHVVTQLSTDGEYVYVTTRRRLEILHPSSGGLMPTCGFELPGALAEIAVNDHAVYIRDYGAMYLVETHPGTLPCHSGLVENASFLSGLTATTPFASAEHVAVGDQRGVYVFDGSTLAGLWGYPEYQEAFHAVTATVRQRTVEYAMRVDTITELLAADSKGNLYLFDLSQQPADAVPRTALIAPPPPSEAETITDASTTSAAVQNDAPFVPPIFTNDGVAAVTRSGDVVGLTSEFERRWPAPFTPPATVTALAVDRRSPSTIAVASGDVVTILDGVDGSPTREIPTTHTVTSLSGDERALILADPMTGALSALMSPTAAGAAPWTPPPAPDPPEDVPVVVSRFVESFNAGDLRAVQSLIGYDAYVWRNKYDGLWERETRERVWAGFEYDFVMGESWTLSDCSIDRDNEASMTCNRVATDIVSEAASAPPDLSTTTFVVRNGILRRIADAFEVWVAGRHDDLHAWVGGEYPEEYGEACVGPRPQSDSAECATLLVTYLDEWKATLAP